MSELYIQSETLENIADAIRRKANINKALTPIQMIEEIEKLQYQEDEIIQRTISGTYVNSFISTIRRHTFDQCDHLMAVNLPKVNTIDIYAFRSCYNLISVFLTNSNVCILNDANAFQSTPIDGYVVSTNGVHGSIYVPASLYSTYQTAENWSVYSSCFVSI